MENVLKDFQLAYSIENLATAFDVSKSTINVEIKEGRLIARKCGTRVLISREDALAWFNALPLRDAEDKN